LSQTGTDFSRVNNLRPVSERADKPGPAANQPDKSAAAGARVRELSPSLSSNSTMYQSLRSYVGKNAKLPGYMDYLHLSTADVAILKGSWAVLEDHVTRVGVDFFLDLINNHEEIRQVFRQQPHIPVYELKATEDLNRHGMYVLGAIKKIVNKIDDTEYLEKLFDDLSDKHRRIGVEASGMDVFGKVFCKVMRPILLEKKKWKPEIKDSWMTFFSSIVKVMKKSETKAENQNQADAEEHNEHRNDLRHQVFRRNNYDRHLIEVGCYTFTQLFSQYPMMDYLAKFDGLEVEGVCIGEALRAHADAIGSVVAEIQENAGNPERIRMSLAQAGHRRFLEGVERAQLDMLGPILAHLIRPLVWEKCLWSVELEKAWTHLFDIAACLMKLGYPHEFEEDEVFPNMAETVIIKDTWEVISKQVKSIGMESFEKLFSLNSDMSAYLPQTDDFDLEETRKLSEKVRGAAKLTLDTLEQVIAAIPDMAEVFNVVTRMLKLHPETGLLEVIGPVFCNTTRHFLLIQGRWSLDVERAWLALFGELSAMIRASYLPDST